ncbi:hypothetical protein OG21DRAFT_1513180 [Imleria badia]|nr:hypothetical protein OG21DRAFT_1513180 [Imleria badia]
MSEKVPGNMFCDPARQSPPPPPKPRPPPGPLSMVFSIVGVLDRPNYRQMRS